MIFVFEEPLYSADVRMVEGRDEVSLILKAGKFFTAMLLVCGKYLYRRSSAQIVVEGLVDSTLNADADTSEQGIIAKV